MIISASRRTDIPATYAEWFMNRLRAGYALVPNPMNPKQVSKVPLTPDMVDAIVLWTKDFEPMMSRLDELDWMGYPFYVQYTITPYGPEVERLPRDKRAIGETLLALSRRIGANRVVWRYDPILLNETYSIANHAAHFTRMADRFAGHVREVAVSFLDIYAKMKTGCWHALTPDEMLEIGGRLSEIAAERNLKIVACCEMVQIPGIGQARCIDPQIIREIAKRPVKLTKATSQRPGCGCAQSVDIGMYDTCPNGCAYCYANRGAPIVARNMAAHRSDGEMLTGALTFGAFVRERKK